MTMPTAVEKKNVEKKVESTTAAPATAPQPKDVSRENATREEPLKQVLSMVDKKVRNLEKRKGKL